MAVDELKTVAVTATLATATPLSKGAKKYSARIRRSSLFKSTALAQQAKVLAASGDSLLTTLDSIGVPGASGVAATNLFALP